MDRPAGRALWRAGLGSGLGILVGPIVGVLVFVGAARGFDPEGSGPSAEAFAVLGAWLFALAGTAATRWSASTSGARSMITAVVAVVVSALGRMGAVVGGIAVSVGNPPPPRTGPVPPGSPHPGPPGSPMPWRSPRGAVG